MGVSKKAILDRWLPKLQVVAGQAVLPRAGSSLREHRVTGKTTGHVRRCVMHGCPGTRIRVRWPDGRSTWPCSEGMTYDEATKTWEIL